MHTNVRSIASRLAVTTAALALVAAVGAEARAPKTIEYWASAPFTSHSGVADPGARFAARAGNNDKGASQEYAARAGNNDKGANAEYAARAGNNDKGANAEYAARAGNNDKGASPEYAALAGVDDVVA